MRRARSADMGGQRGSDGVVPGYTDLGDLRGHPQSVASWVCQVLAGVSENRGMSGLFPLVS